MAVDKVEHGAGFEVLEVLPAHLRVWRAEIVRTLGEDVPLDRLVQRDRLLVLAGLLVVDTTRGSGRGRASI